MMIQQLNPDTFAKKRYQTQKMTYRQWARKISELYLGNQTINKQPLNWSEIANELMVSRDFINENRNLAVKLNYLKYQNGRYCKPELKHLQYESPEMKSFKEIPEIQSWIKFMNYAKHGGELKGRQNHLTKFKHICDTLKVHPRTFITSENTQQVITTCEDYFQQFLDLHKEQKSSIQIDKNTKHILQRDSMQRKDYMEGIRYSYAQAFLSFLKAFKYAVPAGTSKIFAQSIKRFHAKYSDVALTPEQFQEAKQWEIKNEGLDSDFFRWLIFGIESCSRYQAILTARNNYTKADLNGKLAYCLKVTETKTEHINNGVWTKYITIPELQESIDAVSKRSSYLIEDRSTQNQKHIKSRLKQLYKYLKIDKKWLRYIDDDNTGYVMNHQTHTLRHFGCHLWLQRLGFAGIGLVSMIGGWNGMDEAKISYGKPTQQQLLDEIGSIWK